MSKRLNGTSTKDAEYPRDPDGWYIETRACVEQLFDVLDFGDDALIWDPCCGTGNILDVALGRGLATVGSDIVDRFKPGGHRFYRGSILAATKWPSHPGRRLSIISNPPYNEPDKGIAERIIEHVLDLDCFFRAAFIVPLEFQCGQGRYEKFFAPYPRIGSRPSHVVSFSQRPSMPPGQMLEDLGESCRGGGMADYCAVVWTAGGPHRTEHLFAPPTEYQQIDLSARRKRALRGPSASGNIGKRIR